MKTTLCAGIGAGGVEFRPMLLAAARTILLEQGDLHASPDISYDAWLINTLVPIWLVGWLAVRVAFAMWRLGSRHRRGATA